MRFFCPGCWKATDRGFEICPHCSLDIVAFYQDMDCVDKLIPAVEHPEPSTPIRAAWLIGQRREVRAVGALIDVVRQKQYVYLVRGAALGIAVIGPEGCAGELIAAAKVICRDIQAALDLLLNPLRIKATLRV